MGKGRRERSTPLRKDCVAALRNWLAESTDGQSQPLFASHRGDRLSRDAVERILRKYADLASTRCATLRSKRVTPHALRHSAAMQLLQNGVDRTIIALWLGHESVESTQIYIHADIELKEQAMAKTKPVAAPAGRYQPTTSCSPSWKHSDYAACRAGQLALQPVPAVSARHNPRPGIMSHTMWIVLIGSGMDLSRNARKAMNSACPLRRKHRP